jgi:hypothetical protein
LGDAQAEVGHVEGAGHAVEQGRAHQEQRGGREVDRHVVQPGLHPQPAGAVQQQAVGGRQHHLEEHEEVEEVAGQEGAVEAHELQLQQRMEVHAGAVPARGGIDGGAEGDDAGERDHQGRKPVGHQHDAEGRAPVAGQVDADRARPTAGPGGIDPAQQRERGDEAQQSREHAQEGLGAAALLAHQQHQRGRQQRQQDRHRDQVRHAELEQAVEQGEQPRHSASSFFSSPST